MIELIDVEQSRTLEDYASIAHLSGIVNERREEAKQLVPALKGRTVWMVNSTARGGGVAEMLQRQARVETQSTAWHRQSHEYSHQKQSYDGMFVLWNFCKIWVTTSL